MMHSYTELHRVFQVVILDELRERRYFRFVHVKERFLEVEESIATVLGYLFLLVCSHEGNQVEGGQSCLSTRANEH